MFSWGIHVVQNGATLVLTIPMHWLLVILFSIPWLFLPRLFHQGHPLRNLLIGAGIAALYGLFLSSSELTLNRTTQTATPRIHHVPLVDQAIPAGRDEWNYRFGPVEGAAVVTGWLPPFTGV